MSRIKLLNIVGARPQIIKSSAISRTLREGFPDQFDEIILHTGQHYDREMSGVFFEELEIPKPDFNLGVGSARHGKQTASMIIGIEEVLINEKPDIVVIYGDTNSTLAAAIATSKFRIPIVHIEAGLRSFNKTMPEEVNRILSDHVSTLLFAPTDTALKNLMREGFRPDCSPPYSPDNPKIFLSGDIMLDNALFYAALAENKYGEFISTKGDYILATIHRDINTDDQDRLRAIVESIVEIAARSQKRILMPLHPRTVHALQKNGGVLFNILESDSKIEILPPVSYLKMILLEKNSSLIITDSGGVQKEAHFFSKPCIVLRAETEWIELVRNHTALLADADRDLIIEAYTNLTNSKELVYPGFYGDGKAAEFIINEILYLFNR
jgi:UDP-GlcNAc3NAcA epimerase